MKTIYNGYYAVLIETLIRQRKEKGYTQQQIAEKLDKPQSYIAKIEGKERKLDIIEFITLCLILDIQADKIIQDLQNKMVGS